MGINLKEMVSGNKIEIENLAGKTMGIDAYNTIYQFLSTIRDRFTGEPLRDSKGNITSHLSGLFYRTSKLMENGARLVYVFDGKPPEFKKQVVEERIKIRKEAEVKWKEALKKGDVEGVRRYSQAAMKLTSEMVEESKKLLGYMGVSWVQALSEGEAEAAHLAKNNTIWAVGSQDWDSLLFGAPRLVRNLTITGRRKVPRKEKYIIVKPEIIELEEVLKNLGINQDQLIILGILVGTDYNPGGIKGIGPKTALEIVKREKTLENVLKSVKWEFDTKPEDILDFFKNPPTEDIKIKKQDLNPEKLKELMVEEHDFSEERMGSTIKKLEESKEDEKQSSLGKFLGK